MRPVVYKFVGFLYAVKTNPVSGWDSPSSSSTFSSGYTPSFSPPSYNPSISSQNKEIREYHNFGLSGSSAWTNAGTYHSNVLPGGSYVGLSDRPVGETTSSCSVLGSTMYCHSPR